MEKEATGGKYKNRGNKAKEYLKTKDITFFNPANDARFARKLAQIGAPKERKPAILCITKRSFEARISDR
jgi:hypothetical protein